MTAIIRGIRTVGSGGSVTETMHRVHVAVSDPCGRLMASIGDVAWRTPLRSCAKPFQALAMFTSGAIERWSITDQEIALACASHEAEGKHLDTVRPWLERLGLSESDLQCGEHAPAYRQLANNCSGKHTGMLAAALALGASTRDYLRLAHPVQRQARAALAACAGLAPEAIDFAVDGCSAPTAVLSLASLSRAAATLAAPDAVPEHSAALQRIAASMIVHADLVGGTNVLDTLLMRSVRGLIAKRGADGVYLMALPDAPNAKGPIGIALKVEDGSSEARTAAVLATLDRLGVLVPAARVGLADFIRPACKNHRGLLVGHYAAELELRLEDRTPA